MSTKLLAKKDVQKQAQGVPAWQLNRQANEIARKLEFKDFREAVGFLVRIGFEAEEMDHHPDITLSYKRMRLALSTHSEGGLTEKDFKLARKIDELFGAR